MLPALFLVAISAMGSSAPEPGPPLKRNILVMSYNVMFDSPDIGATVRAIKKADPDIVCLTELTPGFQSALLRELGDRYPNRSLHPAKGTWGVGLVAKVPLENATLFAQRPHRMPAIEAVAKTPRGRVRIACLHLFPPVAKRDAKAGFLDSMKANAALRKDQATQLVNRFSKESGPIILTGDFNEGASDEAFRVLRGDGYELACLIHGAHCGATFPGATSSLPAVFQLDHVLGKSVHFESAEVLKVGGSDHYPIIVGFQPT